MLRRLLRILLIPLLLVGLGYGTQQLALMAFGQIQDYAPPPLSGLSPGPYSEPLSQRVVVVVVDGLREDTSRQMPTVQQMRERGADLPSWTKLPAVSLPGYTTLGTGAYPEFSGVLSNWYAEPVGVDSLFARAGEAGLTTALIGMEGWETLYGPWVDWIYSEPWAAHGDLEGSMRTTEALAGEAQRVLRETDAALVYVHFGEVDDVGHCYGGTSPEYLTAALRVDAQIAALVEMLDWSRDTLILTADHGMLAGRQRQGASHGGAEPESRHIPLVMAGRGISPGSYPEGGQADLAPTVATLLGLPLPSHSQGHTRLEALALLPAQQAERALLLGEQQWALYSGYLQLLGASPVVDGLPQARAALAAGQYERTGELVETFLGQVDLAVGRAKANYLWRGRMARLPYLLLPPLAGILFWGLYPRRRELRWPALFALLFFVLSQALYRLVRGNTWSISSIVAASEEAFFMRQVTDTLIVMGLLAVCIGIVWRRRPWGDAVWTANLSMLTIGWAMSIQLSLFLWLYGIEQAWILPHQGWSFKFFLDLLSTLTVAYSAVLVPWPALAVSRLFILYDRVRAWWGRRGWPWTRTQLQRLRTWWRQRRERPATTGQIDRPRRFSPLAWLRASWRRLFQRSKPSRERSFLPPEPLAEEGPEQPRGER